MVRKTAKGSPSKTPRFGRGVLCRGGDRPGQARPYLFLELPPLLPPTDTVTLAGAERLPAASTATAQRVKLPLSLRVFQPNE